MQILGNFVQRKRDLKCLLRMSLLLVQFVKSGLCIDHLVVMVLRGFPL